MFTESTNPADHSEHDPSRCDYARIWLTQQFVAGTHAEHITPLTNEQIARIGYRSAVFGLQGDDPEVVAVYAEHDLTLQQVYDFSEYLRNYLLNDRGLGASLQESVPQGDPSLN